MNLIQIFISYLKKNSKTGKVYSGKTSGWVSELNEKTARNVLDKRDKNHHKNKDDFGKAQVDKVSTDSDAIRGREQMLIDSAKEKGICGNTYNSISLRNKKRKKYLEAAVIVFGTIAMVFLILHAAKIF